MEQQDGFEMEVYTILCDMHLKVDFLVFLKALGTVCLVSWAMKTDLKIDGFLVM